MIVAVLLTAAIAQAPSVPLREGLVVVTANSNPDADYEAIHQVDSVNAAGIHLHVSFPPKRPDGTRIKDTSVTARRRVLPRDQASARHYQLRFVTLHPEVFPGTTALGASTAVLADLRRRGRATFYLGSSTGGATDSQELRYLEDLGRRPLILNRVGTAAEPVSVLVNDAPAELPAIHARGRVAGYDAEFWFLDDTLNPLVLRWKIDRQELQVVKILFPDEVPAARITTALEQSGRAEVYGIYFDVGSARIKPESERVLAEIAGALERHPAWSLGLEGHTDSVGGVEYNLDLSRQRAAAVRDALVSRYGVGAARLSPAGFGASRPKASNATLAGRARNRRVELVRQ